MRIIKEVYYVLNKHQKTRALVLIVMMVFGALFETLGITAIMPLVNVITDPNVVKNNEKYRFVYDMLHFRNTSSFILFLAVFLIALYVFKNLYLIILDAAKNHYVTNNKKRMSSRLMTCYIKQDYLFHTEHGVAEMQQNVGNDVDGFLYVLTNILNLITELLVCIMLFILLLLLDTYITIIIVLVMSLALWIYVKVVKKFVHSLGEQNRIYTEKAGKTIISAFEGIKEIKALSIEDFFIERYGNIQTKLAYILQKQELVTYSPRPIMETLCVCSMLVILVLRIKTGADVNSFIPVMSVFIVAAIRMLPAFNRISASLNIIMYFNASVDALYNDLVELEHLEKNIHRSQKSIKVGVGDIEIRNVTFAYPAKPKEKVLDHVSFNIPQNQSVALIGPSGAGKTTLADIIMGLIVPQNGTIEVNGVNVLEDVNSWHNNIGYIPQSIFLTDDTIRSNVAFGVDEDRIDDAKVWEALEKAQIAGFVRRQAKGLYSELGDRGVRISGGQRQRIGIARALYFDPDIIVLDEATSALDNDTENAVMDAIYSLSGKKTMVIIAHRLSTISKCDYVYEVSDGKVKLKK